MAQIKITVTDPVPVGDKVSKTIGDKSSPISVKSTLTYSEPNNIPPPPPHDHTAVLMFSTQPPKLGRFEPAKCEPAKKKHSRSGKWECTAKFTPYGDPAVGGYSFCASYPGSKYFESGNTKYPAANNPRCPFVVNYALPTTTRSSSSNPSTVGQAVTFSAMVSGGASPQGSVEFTSNGKTITGCEKVTLTPNNAAECTTSFSKPGTYTIMATYLGDEQNVSAGSDDLTQVVTP
ncbi:MAG: Ig-like domain-containing protein [Terriglobales bacterium]